MRRRRQNFPPVPRVCPTCGSRVGAGTRRCLVCGADLTRPGPDPATAGPRRGVALVRALIPFVTVLCLAAFGILFIFGAAGAVPLPVIQLPGQEPTETPTVTRTFTPTPTLPPTMTPLPTALPPVRYIIQPGDSILAIAIEYDVAPWAINELNNLAPDAVLSVGQVLLIPIPTATLPPAPPASATPEATASQ
jgi:LysM repeat protein